MISISAEFTPVPGVRSGENNRSCPTNVVMQNHCWPQMKRRADRNRSPNHSESSLLWDAASPQTSTAGFSPGLHTSPPLQRITKRGAFRATSPAPSPRSVTAHPLSQLLPTPLVQGGAK